MRLLHAGVDITVIALWLGHESVNTTHIYLKPRELHQPGEKPQVSRSARGRTATRLAGTGRQTTSWPSSKPCDYADTSRQGTPATSSDHLHIGITAASA